MALNPLNSSNLEQLALNGLNSSVDRACLQGGEANVNLGGQVE